MKDLIGRWKVSEIMTFDDKTNEAVWLKVEDAMKKPDIDSDIKSFMGAFFDFDDKEMSIIIPIPEDAKEEVDEAVAAGEVTLKDGMVVAEKFEWKMKDGKPHYLSDMEGEVLGEKVDPWIEFKETPDGYEILSFRIVKA